MAYISDPSEKESESQSVEMDTEDSSNKSKRKSASQGSVEPTSNPDKNQSALHENMSTENMSTEDGVSRHDNTMSQPVKNSTEGSPSKSDGNGSVLCQSEAPPDEEEMDVKKGMYNTVCNSSSAHIVITHCTDQTHTLSLHTVLTRLTHCHYTLY